MKGHVHCWKTLGRRTLRRDAQGRSVRPRGSCRGPPAHGGAFVPATHPPYNVAHSSRRRGRTVSIPDRFGKCKLVKLLGQGATAFVFLAKHEVLDIPVAVKVLRTGLSQRKPEYAERFLREAKMAAWLDHPNLVRVIDCGTEESYHYMVMDYVDGPNCLEMVKDQPGGIDWREATEIVKQAAAGLAYAVSKDVIHRDVKPSNIMIDSSGRVRVTDLGLAKLTIRGMASLTQELHTVGTPNYMSPEQIRSSEGLDLRTDIYSLGASYYHMVCGSPPFFGESAMEVVAMHVSNPLEPPFKRKGSLPPALSSIICKMMAKSPGERYQDYSALVADLDNLLDGKEISAADFRETQEFVQDKDELQRILSELQFAAGLVIEDEDPSGFAEADAASPEGGRQGSTEIDLFGPEDFAAFPPREDDESGSTTASQTGMMRRRSESRLGLWLTIAGAVIVLIVLVVAILVLTGR